MQTERFSNYFSPSADRGAGRYRELKNNPETEQFFDLTDLEGHPVAEQMIADTLSGEYRDTLFFAEPENGKTFISKTFARILSHSLHLHQFGMEESIPVVMRLRNRKTVFDLTADDWDFISDLETSSYFDYLSEMLQDPNGCGVAESASIGPFTKGFSPYFKPPYEKTAYKFFNYGATSLQQIRLLSEILYGGRSRTRLVYVVGDDAVRDFSDRIRISLTNPDTSDADIIPYLLAADIVPHGPPDMPEEELAKRIRERARHEAPPAVTEYVRNSFRQIVNLFALTIRYKWDNPSEVKFYKPDLLRNNRPEYVETFNQLYISAWNQIMSVSAAKAGIFEGHDQVRKNELAKKITYIRFMLRQFGWREDQVMIVVNRFRNRTRHWFY